MRILEIDLCKYQDETMLFTKVLLCRITPSRLLRILITVLQKNLFTEL